MKEELIHIVQETENNISVWNRAREYLQARVLGLLQETGATLRTWSDSPRRTDSLY